MDKKIVVINGTGGSGKDTFVSFCEKYISVYNFSSIDKIKEIAELLGWQGGKTEKDRKFLADLKDLSTKYNNLPYNTIKDAINKFKKSDKKLMFIHIREPEEIKKVVNNYNATTLLITRKNYDVIKSNSADANINNYKYDYVIENDTLDMLEDSAKNFVNNLFNTI